VENEATSLVREEEEWYRRLWRVSVSITKKQEEERRGARVSIGERRAQEERSRSE